ncbi:MAG: hypothetical protein QM607_09570 [Microbacterium sp.]
MPNIAADIGKASASLGVNTAYGEPQEIDGEQFVPVAIVWSGFGAGGDETGNGGGGGGGVSLPIGAYARRDGQLQFEPNLIALLTVGVPFVCVVGRALVKIIRALKK